MSKTKLISKKPGIKVPAGPSNGMHHGHQHAGKQTPGQTASARAGVNKSFKADAGPKGGMYGKQSVQNVTPGQTGKGSGGKAAGKGGKKGYGGDANGNAY